MAQVTVTSSGAEPRTYTLNKPRTVLGRDPNAEIHLDNLAVSKHHCEIVQDGSAFTVRDLKSSNKTFVNGKPVEEHRLANGDEIVIGLFAIKFTGAVPETASAPKPAVDEGFEPTMQLPPEMVRKKMEEMQREREQGMSAARAAAASTVKPQNVPAASPPPQSAAPSVRAEKSNSLAVIIVITAVVVVVVVNVVIALYYKK